MAEGATLANVYLHLIPSMAGAQKAIASEIVPAAEKSGKEGGQKAGNQLVGGLKKLIAAAAIGAVIGEAWTNGLDAKKANNKLAASLGLSKDEAGKAGKVAGQLYSQAYGESMADVTGAVGSVISSIEGMSSASEADLQKVAAAAMNIGSAFDMDVSEVAKSAGQMIESGLAETGIEAMDLLTASMQQVPEAMRGDIIDATNEYGGYLKDLGLNGQESLGLLVAASDGGTIAIDKTGDALKEFTIRATDMSKTTTDAMYNMGLDSEVMANELLAGGDRARDAFGLIVDSLLEIEDPAEQANAAIALFGTPLEDLGTAQIPGFLTSLSGMDSALGDVGGASADLGATLNDGMGGFESLKRAAIQVVTDGLTPFIGPANQLAAWATQNPGLVQAVVVGIGALAVALGVAAAAQWVMNSALLANPITWIIVGIVALVAAVVALIVHWDTVVAWLKNVWDGAVKGVKAGLDWLAAQWSAIWGAIRDFFVGLWASIVKVATDHVTAVRNVIAAVWGAVKLAWETVWNGIKGFFSTLWAGIKKIVTDHVGMVRSVIESVTGTIKKGWETVWGGIRDFVSGVWGAIKKVVSDHVKAVRDVIVDITGKIKSAWDTVWGGIKTIGETAWNWIRDTAVAAFDTLKTKVETTIGKLKAGLETIWGGIRKVFATPINAVIGFINKGIVGGYNWVADKFGLKKMSDLAKIPGYADGGWTGPGGKYKPAGIVHADEYVLTKAQVRAMGGPGGVADWLSHAGAPGYAGGGLVTYQGKRFTAIFAALLRKANEMAGGGMHISQGGFRPRTSYSGTSHQGDAVDITGNYRKFIAPLRSVGIPTWDRAGKGDWVDHAHGVPLPGFGSAAGSAVWQAQDYLRGGDGLGGRDNGPRGGVIMQAVKGLMEAIKAGFNSVKEWFDKIVERITGPFKSFTSSVAGGPLGDLVKSVATKLKDELTKWVKDKLGVGYASGTSHASPGLAWVGERGPELVRFRGGEQVIPNHALGGGGVVINGDIHLPSWIRTWEDAHAFLTSPGLAAHGA